MKKLLFTLLFGAIITATANAQSGPQAPAPADAAVMLQKMKEEQKPGLIEKVGLTEEQADRLIEINFETRMAATALKDLPEAERKQRIEELKADKEKKLIELLSPEQITAVKAYYEEMGKKKKAN